MSYVAGYVEPYELPGLLGQTDPRGPGGSSATWFNIAQANWDQWSRSYGDCPEWQSFVAGINRSVGYPPGGGEAAARRGLQSQLVVGQPIPQEWFSSTGWAMWSEVLQGFRKAQRACDQRRAQETAAANGNGVVTGEKARQLIAFKADPIYNDPPPGSWGQCFDVEHPGGQISRICVPAQDVVEARRAQEAADRQTQIVARDAPEPENGEPVFSDRELVYMDQDAPPPEEQEFFGLPAPTGVDDLIPTGSGAQGATRAAGASGRWVPWLVGGGAILALWGMAHGATPRGR